MSLIKLEGVSKTYNEKVKALDDLNLTIGSGEFIVLIGPSGCGKTTLLKMINGLLKPNEGNIYIKNKDINDWDPIELKRSIGYVIQQIGLFPHMTVGENISYVLNIKSISKNKRNERSRELINLVGLNNSYLDRYPRELSGGQKQRIGVARALAANPDIILMDEPFGAVDEITRKKLQDEILQINKKLKKTIVFVTHDIDEAFKLASRIVLLNNGVIEQSGRQEEMLFNPKNNFVLDFFGIKSFTAYLNNLKVKEAWISRSNNNSNIHKEIKNLINQRASVMEGLKILLNQRSNILGIKNNEGKIIAEFTLERLVKGAK